MRIRLTLIVLIATLPALLLALGAGFTHRRLLAEDAHDDAVHVAETGQAHQAQLIADTQDLLESLAVNPLVLGNDREVCSRLLTMLLKSDPDTTYSNLGVVLPDGQMVCSAQPLNGPVYVGDRLYFQRALQTGHFARGEHVIGRISGRGTLLTGLPVFWDEAVPRAVIHAGIDLSWVATTASMASLPPGSSISVIDHHGTVLARVPEVADAIGQPVPPGPLADLIASGGPESGEIVDPDGTAVIYALRPFDSKQDADASIFVAIPRDVALAEANRSLCNELIGVALVALVGLAAAWFGGEAFFLRRVRSLIALAERLARGDLSARTDRRKDGGELGRLEHAFDDMAASIERRSVEREQISQALAVSEARYRSVIDQVQEVIFQTDAAGLWTFLNPAWTDVTGFPVEESLGRCFLEFVLPDDRELNAERFRPLIAREKDVCRHEIRYLTADGGFRWVEVFARLVLADDDSIVGTAGTLMDITERHLAEDATRRAQQAAERESERLLALHRASAALASPTADLDQIVDDILQSAADLVGAEAASLYRWDEGAGLLRCVHNLHVPDGDSTPDVLPGVGLAGHTYAAEAPLIVNDYLGWQHAMASGRDGGLQAGLGVPLRHAGRCIGVLLIRTYRVEHQDFAEDDVRLVSLFADQAAAALENVRLHRSLEGRVERLRTLAWLAQLISSSLATSEVPHEIARAAARLMDAPVVTLWLVDDATGEARVGAFSDPDLCADFPITSVAAGECGIGWVVSHRQSLRVDDVFADERMHGLDWWRAHRLRSCYAVPVVHEDRMVAVLALHAREPFHLDAEDRELLDIFVGKIAVAMRNASLFEALGASNRALEDSVERANALAEQAQAADRAKSGFLSRVSHELRTPLNAILGFAQVLELRDLDEQDRDSVQHILKGGHHLLGLINEVLDISRIESGTLHLSIESVEAGEIVAEVCDLVQSLATANNVTLDVVRPAGPALWVAADRQRFKQILLNLLTNAVKYNRRNGVVTVTCEVIGEQRFRIAVRDSGHGIEQSKLDRLFDPFDRLGAEESGIEGTGLGLTITRSLTEAMGGQLHVESTVGVGSTFTLDLPLAAAPSDLSASTGEESQSVVATTSAPRRTVLYIEDNTPNRVLVERVLAWRPEIELLAASNGRDGIALANDHRPDLVLLDLHLPDMHGYEVLTALHRHASTADVPIVVLTADASPGQQQYLLDSGVQAFLSKPIAVRDLLDTLDTILERAA